MFQRLHPKSDYTGIGIGLAICKKIIRNHKGFINATGDPGIGSVFSIFVPVNES
ncbi:MAG: ATP-binding protein [Chitinophagales bacterium]